MVFVLDAQLRPLAPCHPARARRLLTPGRAALWRLYPCTIVLTRAVAAGALTSAPEPLLRLKLDPGSRTTGLAPVHDPTGRVVWAVELRHRGQRIHAALLARRALRSS